MSIIAYVGLPGSGKSYDVVANQIMPALKDNRRVVTNIPLNRDAVRDVTHKGEVVELPLDVILAEPAKIDEYATAGCVLVIDELWRLWPAGLKADRIPQPFKSLLAEHRHKVDREGRSMQIVFVTQDLSQIAAFSRQLVEQTFYHSKLATVGLGGSYRIDIFHGCVTGAVPPLNKRVREIFGKFKPEIFKLYQSHTMSESRTAGANEKKVDARGAVWKRTSIWVALVACIVVGFWSFSSLKDMGEKYGVVESSEARPTTAAQPPLIFSAEPTHTPPLKSAHGGVQELLGASKGYLLTGFIENIDNPERSVAMIELNGTTVMIPTGTCEVVNIDVQQCEFDGHLVTRFGSTQL